MDQRRRSSRIRGIAAPPPPPPLSGSIRRRRSPPLPPPRPAGAVPLLVPNLPIPSVHGEQPSNLPLDLILEIAARSDAVSIVRFAATSKPLRLAILDQRFRGQPALIRTGFNPDLLLGVSYEVVDYNRSSKGKPTAADPIPSARRAVKALLPSAEPALVRFTEIVGSELEPVACRDGLVVLHSVYFRPGNPLRVCNNITGHTSSIPAADIAAVNNHALLTVGDGGGSFELLVVDRMLRSQLYSSRDGRWSPVRRSNPNLPFWPFHRSCPVVIGRNVHWLCSLPVLPPTMLGEVSVVALHADTAQATFIDLPFTSTSCTMGPLISTQSLILAASPDGKLMVVVSEMLVISAWTLEEEPSRSILLASWSRRVLVDKKNWVFGIGDPNSLSFEGFGERSGILVFVVGTSLVKLNLATKEVTVIFQSSKDGTLVSQACLHEICLPSVLQAMKPLS